MIIHSVAPLSMLMEQPQTPPVSLREVEGGYAEGIETPGGFRMTRLCSTDPALYLKNCYAPGSILDSKTH